MMSNTLTSHISKSRGFIPSLNCIRLLSETNTPQKFGMRKVPQRVLFYSRLANQVNTIRDSNFQKSHGHRDLAIPTLPNYFDTSHNNQPDAKYNTQKQVDDEDSELETLFDGQDFTETIDQPNNIKALWKKFGPLETDENNFIYKHVHERLDMYSSLGDRMKTLPIYDELLKLDQLIGTVDTMERKEYNKNLRLFFSNLKTQLVYMNQQELAILLSGIKAKTTFEYKLVRQLIDLEMRWLLKKHVGTRMMDLDLWFYIADTFYECLYKSKFVDVMVNYLTAESYKLPLTNQQLLHLLFLVITKRSNEGTLEKYIGQILGIADEGNPQEIAIICMAYFKTKTKITEPLLLAKLIDGLRDALPKIDPKQPTYCSIIKCIRYTRDLSVRDNVFLLLRELLVNKKSKQILSNQYNSTQTLKLMETYRIYDESLIDTIVSETLTNHHDSVRFKDVQYTMSSLSNFSYNNLQLPDELASYLDRFCDSITSDDRFDKSISHYNLFPLCRALAYFGEYNKKVFDHINRLLDSRDETILHKIESSLDFEKTALLLYTASRLESNDAHFGQNIEIFRHISNQIDRITNNRAAYQNSSIRYLDLVLREGSLCSKYYRYSNRILNIAKYLGSSEYTPNWNVNFQYTFPHQNYNDIIISTKPKHNPGDFDAMTLMPKPINHGEKHCIIVALQPYDYIDGHERLCGSVRFMVRLLEKLGYYIVYINLQAPNKEKLAYEIKSILDP